MWMRAHFNLVRCASLSADCDDGDEGADRGGGGVDGDDGGGGAGRGVVLTIMW